MSYFVNVASNTNQPTAGIYGRKGFDPQMRQLIFLYITASRPTLVSYQIGNRGDNAVWSKKLTTRRHLVPSSSTWRYYILSPYVSKAWC